MRIIASSTPAPAELRGAVLALGNFDGAHRGHQHVVSEALEHARRSGRPVGAAVFEPHPRQVFQPDAPPFRLQSPGQRARALETLGLDVIFEITFNKALAALSDEEFVRTVLHDQFGAAHVAVGADFTFGRGRMGNVASLTALGAKHGMTVSAASMLGGEAKVSSSTIRKALTEGRLDDAAELLTRPWAIEGIVMPGDARGRTIGFPTLNLGLGAYQRPRLGVYAVRVNAGDGVWRAGVANCGVRPTIAGGAEPRLETHLFDFEGDLYGKRIEVALLSFLRDEKKFETLDALKAQIAVDATQAKAALLAR